MLRSRSLVQIPVRTLSITGQSFCYNKPRKVFGEPLGSTPGSHPERSNWLQWTDPLPIQEHARDVKLKDSLKPALEEPKGPRLDKLYKTIELEALAYEPAVLDSYEWFVVAAATHLGITVGKRWNPEKSDKMRFNLLRSVHIFKKHQVHYEVRTYHRFINLHKLTGSTADTFLEYIERNLPEGVGLKVTKFEVQRLPEHIESSSSNNQP